MDRCLAPVSTHLGVPQWQALSTARNAWGRALSTSWVKQWPVVSPSHTGSGCNTLVSHSSARNRSMEVSPVRKAEGGGRKGSSRGGGSVFPTARSRQGAGTRWDGVGTATRKPGWSASAGPDSRVSPPPTPPPNRDLPSLGPRGQTPPTLALPQREVVWHSELADFRTGHLPGFAFPPPPVSPPPEIRNV